MDSNLILCIDIGGTHITAAVLDRQSMSLHKGALAHEQVDSQGAKENILLEWDRAIAGVLHRAGGKMQAVFVSIPGPFDYEQGICLMDGMHKYQSLLHMDVKSYFADRYSFRPERVFFFNDALAFLLGEVYHYRWRDKTVVGLTLGTGLGSALYSPLELKDLNYGSADFRDGIAEDYISTRGVLDFLSTQTDYRFKNVKEVVHKEGKEKERTAAFTFLTDALLDFIRMYITPLNPDVIVLGGSIAKAHELFLKELEQGQSIPVKIASMDEMNLFLGMASTWNLND